MSNKTLSIITINYNNSNGLKKTMESVAVQTWKDFEHIVVDGNSNDQSTSVIKSFDYKNLYWNSEPDKGIYNAMNKGVKQAQGKYLLFLNSGDFLFNQDVLHNLANFLDGITDLVVGGIITKKGEVENNVFPPKKVTLSYLLSNSLPHPASFYKRDLFVKYGNYNEDNKIVSDWEFNLNLFVKHNIKYKVLDQIVSIFDLSGISSSLEHKSLLKEEGERVVLKIFGGFVGEYIINSLKENAYKPNTKKKILSLLNKVYKWQ